MSLDCVLDGGYSLGCRDSRGGVKANFFGTFSGTTAWTVDADGILTGATAFNRFFEFEAPSETLNAMDTGTYSKENYTNFQTQIINGRLFANTQTERDLLFLLASYRMFAIVEDNNGDYYLYGRENGCWLTASEANFGTALEDSNTISFTLEGKEPYLATQVSPSLIATLIA